RGDRRKMSAVRSASESNEEKCTRVYPVGGESASNGGSSGNVACFGASRSSGEPSGAAINASRISVKQRKVFPLPAGPRSNRARTADVRRRPSQSKEFIFD